jgi:2-polyprenyl-6-methoxyphenol hydroxylase-like FAD-dependent oxidoreductase
MKVVIAGAGAVGTFVGSDLRAAGHDVLLIERNPDLVGSRRRATWSVVHVTVATVGIPRRW